MPRTFLFMAVLGLLATWAPSVPASQPTTVFSVNFDAGTAPGWDLAGEWHVSDCRGFSGSNSLAFNHGGCPPVHDNNGASARSPVIDLPAGYTSINLKFKSWYNMMTNCLGGPCPNALTVSITTDNWQTSTQIYDEDESQNIGSWNDRTIDIAAYDGKEVSIGFWCDPTYDGRENEGDEGWFIDDIRVEATVTPPPAPKNLDAQRGSNVGEIKLTWEAPAKNGGSAVTGYKVFRGNAAGSETFLQSVGNVLTFTDTGLPNGATRFYKVKALNAEGDGDLSNEDSATAPDVPSAPQNPQAARGASVGTIRLDWTAPASTNGLAVTNYKIYRGDQAGGETFLVQLGDVRTHTDTGLANGAQRFYKFTALNAAGESVFSAEVNARAPDVPTAPQNPSAARGNGAGQIKVDWQAPATDNGLAVTNYKIFRGFDAGSLEFLTQVGNVLTFTDSGLPNGATRFYAVSALNAAGEGAKSNTVSATTGTVPGQPTDLQALPWIGLGQVRLTWSAPDDDGGFPIANYRIYRLDESVGQWELAAQIGNVHAYIDGGRTLGHVYHYRVSAVNGAGEGVESTDVWMVGTAP